MTKLEKSGGQGTNTYYTSNEYIANLATSSRESVLKIFAHSFIILILAIVILNIFNTVSSSIELRRREFSVLKSVGMSKKQLNRMLFLEGILYSLDSIIYGVVISLIILFIMFIKMRNVKIYAFTIPWLNIAESIATTYIITFIAMWHAKRKIRNKNIIDDIKNENI